MTNLEFALKYASEGIPVFPVYEVGDGICACLKPDCKNPGKHPRVNEGLLQASTNQSIIRAWWERWPNANIGARTDTFVVLDVDDRQSKRGIDSLSELGFDIANFDRVNRTGSGGYHVFFKQPDPALNNRQAMKPGLDLRGQGGYVILPPSTHFSGDVYSVFSDGEIKEVPEKLLELFRSKAKKLTNSSEKLATDGKFGPGERDNKLLAFAGKMRRYGFGEAEIFAALKVTNELRCDPPKAEADIERLARNACRYEPTSPITPGSAALFSFISQANLVVNIQRPEDYLLVDFKTGRTRRIHTDIMIAELGRDDFRLFRANREIRAEFAYNPRELQPLYTNADDGITAYNEYVPPQWKRGAYYRGEELMSVQKLPEIYERFFRHLTGNDEPSFHYLVDWLAHSLRDRNHTMLTAIGDQGIGKGTLGLIMQKLHGDKNYDRVRDTVFKERFNARLKHRTMLYVDEIDLRTKESQDRIKDVVNEYIEIEEKGRDPITVQNFASYYLSSNTMDAVKIEAGDRRFSVIQLTDQKLIHTPLMSLVPELMKDDNIAELGRYLQFKPIKRDMFTPFRSARFEMVREAGLKDWEFYVIDEWAPKFKGREVEITSLQEAIREDQELRTAPGRRKIEELVAKYPELLKITRRAGQRWVAVTNWARDSH